MKQTWKHFERWREAVRAAGTWRHKGNTKVHSWVSFASPVPELELKAAAQKHQRAQKKNAPTKVCLSNDQEKAAQPSRELSGSNHLTPTTGKPGPTSTSKSQRESSVIHACHTVLNPNPYKVASEEAKLVLEMSSTLEGQEPLPPSSWPHSVCGHPVRTLDFYLQSERNEVLSPCFLRDQCHRKPDKVEGLNETQGLLTSYANCPGFNLKSLIIPRTRKAIIGMK